MRSQLFLFYLRLIVKGENHYRPLLLYSESLKLTECRLDVLEM